MWSELEVSCEFTFHDASWDSESVSWWGPSDSSFEGLSLRLNDGSEGACSESTAAGTAGKGSVLFQ